MFLYKLPLTAVTIALVLSGCAGYATIDPEEKHYVTPDPGSKVEVAETLTAETGTRVSLQHGRVLKANDLVKWKPYCQFHVLRPRGELNKPLRIEPGLFMVERVYRQKDLVTLDGIRYAGVFDDSFEGHGPSQRTMATYMELSSIEQPDVYQLVCQRWDDPYDYNHVSIREIRESLGELVRLDTR